MLALNKKTRKVPNGARTVQEKPELSLDQAFLFAIAAKKSKGLRERLLKDYEKHYGYFVKWLREKHPEVTSVSGITPGIIRDHIAYSSDTRGTSISTRTSSASDSLTKRSTSGCAR